MKHFGEEVLQKDGTLDRKKLAGIIFEDGSKRHLLNRCTHPFIQKAMMWEVAKFFLTGKRPGPCSLAFNTVCYTGKAMVILVSPLLFETGKYTKWMKKTIVVHW